MNLEQAKLILSSFRPNGADAEGPAFAQALELAVSNEELGLWLASERAQDLAFAEILNDVPIPDALREDIYTVLASTDKAPGYDQVDHQWAAAFSELTPPSNLRNEILAAMEVEQKVTPIANGTNQTTQAKNRWFSVATLGKIAAAVVLSTVVWKTIINPADPSREIAGDITPISLKEEAISFLDSRFVLDRNNSKQEALYQYLASNDLPAPEALPAGLEGMKGVGCKRLDFNEHPASLICYKLGQENTLVHLMVLRRDAIEGELPLLADAAESFAHNEESGWSVANWRDEDKAFFLMSKVEPEQLAALF